MKYDFDREIDRRGTSAVKWEFIQAGEDLVQWERTDRFYGEGRTLPLWVADMDFRCPEPVVQALVQRAQHGIYGYTAQTASYHEAVVGWMYRRHGWRISPEWICTTPGVVPALNMMVRTFVSPGEAVLIQPPVYYPFFSAIKANGARLVTNPLALENGRYTMDFADLETKIQDPAVRMLILCSPHNPVGRVWSREELTRLGEICLEREILVIADEIHGDLIHRGYDFTSFGRLDEPLARRAIICTAPSKTFNLAGLHTSNILIPDEELRSRFEKTLHGNGLFGIGTFGVVALEAAYNHGEEWLEQVIDYIGDNLQFLQDYIHANVPRLTVIRPEGTYLVWLDCRGLGLDKWELKRLMLDQARVYLDEGFIFGPEGEGFERINIACPRSVLAEALARIKDTVDSLPPSRVAG
jgi:cystathionine beta-lyase